MAQVATRGPLPPNPLHLGGSSGGGSSTVTTTAAKRMTPSELRGEQLKRKKVEEHVDESPTPNPAPVLNNAGLTFESKRLDPSKNPRYIDTRMDEVFRSKKLTNRLKLLSRKVNTKENIAADHFERLRNSPNASEFATQSLENQVASSGLTKDDLTNQSSSTTQKCSKSIFRSVKELSLGDEKLLGFSLDMDKAFKGLAACEPPIVSQSAGGTSAGNPSCTSANIRTEIHIPSRSTPLDFTLKTSMRVLSSSSVNWFHRLMNSGTFNGNIQFNPLVDPLEYKMTCPSPHTTSRDSFTKASLHYWVYPQSSLPPAVVSALTLSAKEEGQMDFLSKRQSAWMESFRSLYYMLRKNVCNIFYVCTAQFVALFTGRHGFTESRGHCSAYISQSTRFLRSLLKEHDICFSMPLCHSKVEQVTSEDLFELSEIEKHNLGQTRRTTSISDVDNSPESLLVFRGHNNVHGLYDFLLNYRFFLTSLTGVDVPSLYSPVPFENASFCAPEVRCKGLRGTDHISVSAKGSLSTSEPSQGSTTGTRYSIEIKDTYLPPWIICNICDAMLSSGNSFEASFVTDPMSIGLNACLDMVSQSSDPKATTVKDLHENNDSLGTKKAISLPLYGAFIKGLKYSDGSYRALLSPV